MITLQTFSSRIEAELVKGMLESNGVRCVVSADDQGGLRPSMAFASGVDLKVNSEDLEQAQKILSEYVKSE